MHSVATSTREREALDQAIVRGSELLKQGKLDQAQRAFHRAHEIDPENTKVLALLGLAYFRANQFAEARPIYEELVARAPDDASGQLNLGLVYLKLGEGDAAIEALEASRALDPSQGRAISYLGLAYARAGRYIDAYRSFLLAGQNELASEIEANLPATERVRIQVQVARPAMEVQRASAPAPMSAGPRTPLPRPSRHMTPTAPPPLGFEPAQLDDAHQTPTAPISPVQSGARPSTRAITQNVVQRGRPTSAPPAFRERLSTHDDYHSYPTPPPAPDITIVSGQESAARPPDDDVAIISLGPPPRMTESQQFVMTNRPAQAVPQPQPGHTMVSTAVEAAGPVLPAPPRTPSGGRPARPLGMLATEGLVRADEGDERFEIVPNGCLVIRVVDRMHVRLEGVHVTGGDLVFEPATRRTRGHQTEERFDHGGGSLHVVSGRGYMIATPGKYTFEAVVLDDDILYLREDLVFAFEHSLRWENGNVPGMRGRLPVVQFRGDGEVALRMARPLVRVKIPLQGLLYIDAERIAGWVGRVIPRAVVPPSGGPLGAMCIECTGEGIVLIEPAPEPQRAGPGPGLRRTMAPPAPPAAAASEARPSIPPELANLDDDAGDDQI